MGTVITYISDSNETREYFTAKTNWPDARKDFDRDISYTAIIDHELVENDF